MKKSYLFLADGFEELEALSPVDVMRRAGMEVVTVSINGSREVTGAHGVTVKADKLFSEPDYSDAEWLICPGGMPGAQNLYDFEGLRKLLIAHYEKGGLVSAICAAPAVVFYPLGIIDYRTATCYPGMEGMCDKSYMRDEYVEKSGNVVTAEGPGAAIPFALTMVAISVGKEAAKSAADAMLYNRHVFTVD